MSRRRARVDALRAGLATLSMVSALAPGTAAGAPSSAPPPGTAAPTATAVTTATVERAVRYVLVHRSKARIDLDVAAIQRPRVVGDLPRGWVLRRGVLSGRVRHGRAVVHLRGLSTATGEEGRHLRLKVVLVGRHQVARRGTVMVSRSPRGRPGNGSSRLASTSSDGSVVAFISEATNLLAEPLPRTDRDVDRAYVWDRETGRTELVSIGPKGARLSARWVEISSSGTRVLFLDGSTGALYLRDRIARSTRLVAGDVDRFALSVDDRLVTYQTTGGQVRRRDLVDGTTVDVGVPEFTAVSPRGRFIAVTEVEAWTPEQGYDDVGVVYVWDTATRARVAEWSFETRSMFCSQVLLSISDDARRGVLSRGCDGTGEQAVVSVATRRNLSPWAARVSTDDAARWFASTTGSSEVRLGRVGSDDTLAVSRPRAWFRHFTQYAVAHPAVEVAGDGRSVAWSTHGTNVVKRGFTDSSQVYVWTRRR